MESKKEPVTQNTVKFVDEEKSKISKGMESTIVEMLQNYAPTSSDRKPFWCRVCRHQSASHAEFNEHNKSEIHAKASKLERKLSSCKVCKKEFTSPDQLREHLNGKSHKEVMEKFKKNNRR